MRPVASTSRLNHSEDHLNGSVARPTKSTPIQSRFVDDDFSSTKRLIYLDAATFTANLNAIESGVAVSRGAEMRWNGPSVANVASTGVDQRRFLAISTVCSTSFTSLRDRKRRSETSLFMGDVCGDGTPAAPPPPPNF